jgi:UDP-glucose 4-epimerase
MFGEVYNVGSGREVSIFELANIVLKALDNDSIPQFDSIVPIGNPLNWQADITNLKKLEFIPNISLEKGIQTFVSWCRAEVVGI